MDDLRWKAEPFGDAWCLDDGDTYSIVGLSESDAKYLAFAMNDRERLEAENKRFLVAAEANALGQIERIALVCDRKNECAGAFVCHLHGHPDLRLHGPSAKSKTLAVVDSIAVGKPAAEDGGFFHGS